MRNPYMIIKVSLLLFAFAGHSQIGIGTTTPDTDAILDVSSTSKGLLLPRLALTSTASASPLSAHIAGMSVYNTATTENVKPGFYFNDGLKWNRYDRDENKFFYAPTVSIPVTTVGTGYTFNLYNDSYLANLNAPAVRSTGAPVSIPTYAASDLFYYVTNYDSSVFSNISIDASGVMTYDIISVQASSCSFINVIFVIK